MTHGRQWPHLFLTCWYRLVLRTHAVIPPLLFFFPSSTCCHPLSLLPMSSALLPSSRLTSVARCSSWRRASILAGTPGQTATAVIVSCPSDPSAWYDRPAPALHCVYIRTHGLGYLGNLSFPEIPGSHGTQDLPVRAVRLPGQQDGDPRG